MNFFLSCGNRYTELLFKVYCISAQLSKCSPKMCHYTDALKQTTTTKLIYIHK